MNNVIQVTNMAKSVKIVSIFLNPFERSGTTRKCIELRTSDILLYARILGQDSNKRFQLTIRKWEE